MLLPNTGWESNQEPSCCKVTMVTTSPVPLTSPLDYLFTNANKDEKQMLLRSLHHSFLFQCCESVQKLSPLDKQQTKTSNAVVTPFYLNQHQLFQQFQLQQLFFFFKQHRPALSLTSISLFLPWPHHRFTAFLPSTLLGGTDPCRPQKSCRFRDTVTWWFSYHSKVPFKATYIVPQAIFFCF